MARRVITGVLTYSSTANRDAALSRITTALAPYTYVDFATSVGTSILTSGNSVNISIAVEDETTAPDVAKAIYDAAVQTTRQTSGYLAVNKI